MIIEIEGKKVEVDDGFAKLTPEQQNATVDEIASQIGATPAPVESDQSKGVREDLAATSSSFFSGEKDENSGLRKADSFVRGAADTASFGLADEITASAQRNNVLNPENYNTPGKALDMVSNLNPITAMVNQVSDIVAPDETTQSNLRRERAFQAQRDDIDSGASTAGRISGALLGAGALTKAAAPYMASLPANATLGAKVAQGAKAGALYSGLYGIGSGEGLTDRVAEGVKQAAIGGAIGGAIPAITAGVKAVTKPVTDAVTGYSRPEAFANKKVAERLANANLSVEQATKRLESNPGNSLADIGGKSAQNLLKTATNIPGKAQQRVQTQLVLKQMQQGDRIRNAVRTTLADPDGYLTAKDDIAKTASDLAAPLYKQAYDTPIPFTQSLEDILHTPAGKRALIKAQEKMANSQSEFRQMFANVADDGTVKITRVPDTQGWDYIKRALDDEIGQLRRAGVKDDARILTNLKNRMLDEIDQANPAFAQARKVWSGQASMDDALELGREALEQSPEATRRLLAKMSEADKQAYRIGVADALRKKIGKTDFTHNALLKFFSSRDAVANLRAAFASDEQFAAFRKAMFSEARKRSTYNVVTGNSSTAKQMADMMESGGLRDGVDFAQNAITSGPVSATLRWIGSRMKMLGGFTPEVADQVARKLMATDPATVKKITTELMKIEAQQISADQKRQLIQRLITPMLAAEAQQLRQR